MSWTKHHYWDEICKQEYNDGYDYGQQPPMIQVDVDHWIPAKPNAEDMADFYEDERKDNEHRS